MHELVTNLHMHTRYSDGTGLHKDIAEAALDAGLDVVIVTDHNVLVNGMEGYHRRNGHKLLMLIGEEVHNQARQPQKNHLLVFGAGREMATYAEDPQHLIDQVGNSGGICFIAHPRDPEMRLFHEDDISWVSWEVDRYTGIELWNGLSELKVRAQSWPEALFYGLFPNYLAQGPIPEVLERWDALLESGKRIVAVGGSDAHMLNVKAGPFRAFIYPYQFHYRAINTHIFTPTPLTGDLVVDRKMIYQAFRSGHCHVGYDLPASTRGFHFTAQSTGGSVMMGDEMTITGSITLQVRLPLRTECILKKDGHVLKTWKNQEVCTLITDEPGIYRVEAYIHYLGKRRGWIFSNPIYLRPPQAHDQQNGPQWSQTTLPVY